MKLLGYDVPLGMSVTSHKPSDIKGFVENGFTHFEVGIPRMLPGEGDCHGKEEKLVDTKRALVAAIEEENLRVWSVHLPFWTNWNISSYDEAERDVDCAAYKRVIELTAAWHPRVYVLHGSGAEVLTPEIRSVCIARSIQSLRELDAFAQRFGARIALENLPQWALANTAVETRAMMLAAGVPICFDVNHLLGDSHEHFLSALATHVVTTHLSDYDGIDERHWLPGKGIVPWKQVFLGLQKAGYRGPYLFELGAGENGLYQAEETLEAFRKALEK